MRSLLALVLFVLPLGSSAQTPLELVLAPANFALGKPDVAYAEALKKLGHSEHVSFDVEAQAALSSLPVDEELAEGLYADHLATSRIAESERKRLVQEYKKKFASTLREHLLSTARQHQVQLSQEADGSLRLRAPDAIPFLKDLLGSPVPERRIAAQAFLRSSIRQAYSPSAVSLVASLVDGSVNETRIVETRSYTEADWRILLELAEKEGDRALQKGRFVLIGNGPSLHLTSDLVDQADQAQDPALRRQFDRVMSFLNDRGVPLSLQPMQTANAFFSPSRGLIGLASPTAPDFVSLTHEGTHARFKDFKDQLERWAEAKHYAIPYEIDGPPSKYDRFGGYMNLLNELNSWRLRTLSEKMTDEEILKTLRAVYGHQAGEAATQTFVEVWTPERIAHRSVARLILDSVRRLNQTSPEELLKWAERITPASSEIEKQNFIRLVEKRFAEPSSRPAPISQALSHLGKVPLASASASSVQAAKPARSSLDELLTQLELKPGDDLLRQLLKQPVASLKPAHWQRVVEWSLGKSEQKDPKLSEQLTSRSLILLEKWLDSSGLTPFTASPVRKPIAPSAALEAIDRTLEETFFEKAPSHTRVPIVNLIAERSFPEELPRFRERLVKTILSPIPEPPSDVPGLLASYYFMVPEDRPTPGSFPWRRLIANATLSAPQPTVRGGISVADYYRLVVSEALDGPRWGSPSVPKLDAGARSLTEDLISRYSASQRTLLGKATQDLWRLLSRSNPKVSTAAYYAIIDYPPYLLSLEDKVLAAIQGADPALRLKAIRIVSATDSGFLPKVEAWIGSGFAPSTEEARLLANRNPFRAIVPGFAKCLRQAIVHADSDIVPAHQ